MGAQSAFAQMGHSDSACLMGMFTFGNRLSDSLNDEFSTHLLKDAAILMNDYS
ncbi:MULTISPECIES: hypothetical protein [Nitrosomonas]|uniref:Uncharacterized protein n=1 Tax=Nitrosomonas communis TaxID=44574 RepID=A0A5D3Y9Z0_9PROT|nr:MULTISPECIES: hypothetical protein [Nitrosomonas]TYP75784.1 hypothetical protein BCL69_10835 [Nitrosomonas communis]UVS60584.1 hypothetical protein NX761_13890 [Nitrosomonas sp. PLL12]